MRFLVSAALVLLIACVSEDRAPTGGTATADGGSSSGASSGSSGASSGSSGASSGSSGSDAGIRCASLPGSAVLRLSAASLPSADGAPVTSWTSTTLVGHPAVTAACTGATLRKTATKSSLSFAGAGGCEIPDGVDTRIAEADFAVLAVAEPQETASSGTYDAIVSKVDSNRGFLLGAPFLQNGNDPVPAGAELTFGARNVVRTLELDTTTHVFAVSRLGAKLSLFVDGVATGTNDAAAGNDDVTTSLVIGNAPSRSTHGFQGRIFEVIVLRAPTEADVTSLNACLNQAFRP